MTRNKRYKYMENNKKSGKRKMDDKPKSSRGPSKKKDPKQKSKRHRSTQDELAKKVTNPNLECPNCGRICAVKRTLEEHVAKCGIKQYSPAQLLKKKLKCPYDKCEFLGEYPSKLERHLKRHENKLAAKRKKERETSTSIPNNQVLNDEGGANADAEVAAKKRRKERGTSKSTSNNQVYQNANVTIPGTSTSIGLIELMEPNQFIAIQTNNENPDEYHVYVKLKHNFVRNDRNEFSPVLTDCDTSSSHKRKSLNFGSADNESDEQSSFENQRPVLRRMSLTPTKSKAKGTTKGAADIDSSPEGAQSSVLLPPPAASRVLRSRNATMDRQISIPVSEDGPEDADDRARPPKMPKRIARRRDTFCEVIDTPEKGDGSRAIKIKITSEEGEGAKTAAATMPKTPNRMDAKRLKSIYNVDKSMHSRSEPTTCALCSATPRFLVHHYVNEHFGYEVCHARMPPETTESLRDGGSTPAVHEDNKITALCHYCEKLWTFAAKDWVLHITRHTGEYMRLCNKCNLKCVDDEFKPSAQCAHDDVGVWNNIEIKSNALGVFVCNQCNYSQLLEENLQKHVRQMHSISKNPKDHYEFVELIPNMCKRRTRRTATATATSATAIADYDSEMEPANPNVFKPSEHSDGLIDTDTFKESADDAPGPSQGAAKNVMADKLNERLRKQDAISDPKRGIENIDVAMECPEEVDGSSVSGRRRQPLQTESSPSAASAATSRIAATVAAANRQNKETIASRKAAAVNIRANVNNNKSDNSDSDDNAWESCTGSEDADEDDGSVANESDSKNKMIASMLTRLDTKLGKSKAKSKKKIEPKRLHTSIRTSSD